MSLVRKVLHRLYPPRHALFYLQRQVMHPDTRARFANFACRRLPALAPIGDTAKEALADLDRDGYVMLPDLASKTQIDDIFRYLADKPVYDRWKPESGTFDVDRAPPECHTAPYRDGDVVNCPHVLGWANNPQALAIASSMLGAKPTISNLTIWWSYPGHDTPQEAENFHRDVDDLRFVKLFVYLTDVDDGCGPHTFVPGSQRVPEFLKIRRYTDIEVEQRFGADGIKRFKGPRGTSFLENTFGLHKGQLPATGRRLLFQAQYSLHPIGIYNYVPVQRTLDEGFTPDRYVNRLFVK
jgi:hypothetical protein